MERVVKAACVQAEPVVLDRDATLEKLERLTAEAAGEGAELVVFPEAFIPVYPSSTWAKHFAGWADERSKAAFARIAEEAVAVPGPAADRLGATAKAHGVWLVTGVTEIDPERPGTLYNTLLYHGPDGSLALKHRKLVPTNHERLVWGPGDGSGLRAIQTGVGRLGGLICWENHSESKEKRHAAIPSRSGRALSPGEEPAAMPQNGANRAHRCPYAPEHRQSARFRACGHVGGLDRGNGHFAFLASAIMPFSGRTTFPARTSSVRRCPALARAQGSWSPNLLRYRRLNQAIEREE